MVTTESQRGNALHRTLKIPRALMRGEQHDRYTAAALSGLSHAQAYRQLELMKGLPGFSSKIDGSRRIYFCEAASLLKRPTPVATVAACFGASLSGLLEGTAYQTAMHEALRYVMGQAKPHAVFRDVDRKFKFISRGGEVSFPDKAHLLDKVVDALLAHNVVSFHYQGRDGTTKQRKTSPLSLVIFDHQFYVIGRENEANEIRLYRFARMTDVERLDETFSYPSKSEYDPETIFRDSLGAHVSSNYPIAEIRIRLAPSWKTFVNSHRWHATQQVVVGKSGMEVTLRVRLCPEVETWILGFGEDAEVLSPPELREQIARRIGRSAAIYAKPAKDEKATPIESESKPRRPRGRKPSSEG